MDTKTKAAADAVATAHTETAVVPASAPVLGFKCPYTHSLFTVDELAGYGNPPRSPACPIGHGQGAQMIPAAFTIAGAVRQELPGAPFLHVKR